MNREVLYDRNASGSYMKIPVVRECEFDEKILLSRKLPGLLPMDKVFQDNRGMYWYTITGKQSLDAYCRIKRITSKFLEELVLAICAQMEILEWNLVSVDSLMLDPELVFVSNDSEEIIFSVYPGNREAVIGSFRTLMEYIITQIDHSDAHAIQLGYEMYEKSTIDGASLFEIRDQIRDRREQVAREEMQKNTIPTREVVDRDERNYENYYLKEEPAYVFAEENKEKNLPKGKKDRGKFDKNRNAGKRREEENVERVKNSGERNNKVKEDKQKYDVENGIEAIWEYLCELWENMRVKIEEFEKSFVGKEKKPPAGYQIAYSPEEECVMEEKTMYEPQIHPTICIQPKKDHAEGILLYEGMERMEDYRIESDTTRVGKETQMELRIPKETISRFHARITRGKDGEYVLEDMNSTNGTYVNDEILSYKERKVLQSNDIVRFADVKYRFI